jgi:hypothetical protein
MKFNIDARSEISCVSQSKLFRRSEKFLERSYGGLMADRPRHESTEEQSRQLPSWDPDKIRVCWTGWYLITTRIVGGEDLYTQYSPDS